MARNRRWYECKLNGKLCVISLVLMIEGIYQLIVISCVVEPFYRSPNICNTTYDDIERLIIHYAFFYRFNCGPKRILDFASKNFSFDNIYQKQFLEHVDGHMLMKTKTADMVHWYLNLANLLDVALIIINIPIFTISFCTSQIERCLHIILAWIVILWCVILFDVCTIPMVVSIFLHCQSPSTYLRVIGVHYQLALAYATIGSIGGPYLRKYILKFPRELMFVAFRHGISLPFFVLSHFCMCKIYYHLYKQSCLRKQERRAAEKELDEEKSRSSAPSLFRDFPT